MNILMQLAKRARQEPQPTCLFITRDDIVPLWEAIHIGMPQFVSLLDFESRIRDGTTQIFGLRLRLAS